MNSLVADPPIAVSSASVRLVTFWPGLFFVKLSTKDLIPFDLTYFNSSSHSYSLRSIPVQPANKACEPSKSIYLTISSNFSSASL